ncbi:MAG: 4Fe-4S dicluster domain-containing protein [bacterium]
MMIYLCRDLERRGGGLNLAELEKALARRHPGAEVRISEDSCRHPEDWLDTKSGDGRFVLGVCAVNRRGTEFRARLRKLGLDPSAVEVVDIGGLCAHSQGPGEAAARARLFLEAAVQKLRAHAGSRPENAKMLVAWEEEMSRRSLFTLPPVRYEVIPSVRDEACVADEGCRICSSLCPHAALAPSGGGVMTLSKDRCTGCGACVSSCPRGAFDFPGAALPQVQAEAGALLAGADLANEGRGIMFLCQNAAAALREGGGHSCPDGWLPVEIPCLGMVTPSWILQCLARGAAAVSLLPCPAGDCKYGEREALEGGVDYCRSLAEEMGLPGETVRLFPPGEPEALNVSPGKVALTNANGAGNHRPAEPDFSPHGAGSAIMELAKRLNPPPELSVTHPRSPLGVIEVLDGCTVCGACANLCPAGALTLEKEDDGISLAFRAAACVGCAGCLDVCPENIMELEKRTDLQAIREESRILYRDTAPRCENCGGPIAPQAMLDRIGGILKDHPSFSMLTKYCIECRKTMF